MGQVLSDLSISASSVLRWLGAHSSPFRDDTHTSSASTKPQPYQYERIKDEDSIRMLRLEPGKVNDPLEGSLEIVKIGNAGIYEPLSYVWGTPDPLDEGVHAITLHEDGRKEQLMITKSLYRALKQLRYPDRERRVWVDQVCIDQANLDERSTQVKFMNTIYKNASRVLVWLGPDEERRAKAVFKAIRELGQVFEAEEKRDASQQSSISARIVRHLRQALVLLCGACLRGQRKGEPTVDIMRRIEESKDFLNSLTDLPWFKRGWIVQEIGTEAPATMFWGNAEIEWATLYEVCERLTDYHHLRRKLNVRTANIKYFFERFVEPDLNSYHANRFNFIYELHRARELSLTDERDRVFALLGHYSIRGTNEELAKLEADYNKPLVNVYIDVARRALEGEQGNRTGSALIALAAVQHDTLPSNGRKEIECRHSGSDTEERELPSWVADWRTYQSFILSEPINPHRAHGKTEPKLEISENQRILKISGVGYDTVVKCSRQLQDKEFHTKQPREATKLAVEYLWEDICDKRPFNLSEKYQNIQEDLFAMMQTLSNGCVQIAGREGKDYHDIPRKRWLKEHARYLVSALNCSDALCPELLELAKFAAGECQEEIWSRAANGASNHRKFARTRKGNYVLGPKVMEEGDIVCVLFGGKLPFCLRPLEKGRFLLVGECYVHGLMEGETIRMLEQNKLSERVFEIV